MSHIYKYFLCIIRKFTEGGFLPSGVSIFTAIFWFSFALEYQVPPIQSDENNKSPSKEEKTVFKSARPSPEVNVSDEKKPVEKFLEGLERMGGKGKKVALIEVHGVIDLGLSAFIERIFNQKTGFSAIILDINTPGGRVDAALNIRDTLLKSKIKTVAFIHPRAISAGALISYACDIIAISSGGSIGAATPIAIGANKEEAVDEKMISYFRAEMASTARAKGRRGDIAEAMVDKDISIEGITEAGKLLTLDTDNAIRLQVADIRVDSVEELLSELSLEGAEIIKPSPGWAEKLARILTHPLVSGLLMTLGVLAILIDLYHPGFGAPGIIGISCLALFFFGHLVVKLAGWEELLLLLTGITLILLEIFVFPGHLIFGIIGTLFIIASLTMALTSFPLKISFETGFLRIALIRTIISIAGSILLFIVAIKLIPKIKIAHPLVEQAAIISRAYDNLDSMPEDELKAGTQGKALSHLRPSGKATFGSRTVEVMADSSFIEEGSKIVIVRKEGGKIIVRQKEK